MFEKDILEKINQLERDLNMLQTGLEVPVTNLVGNAIARYMALPSLRGLWVVGAHQNGSDLADFSGGGYYLQLQDSGSPIQVYTQNGMPAGRSYAARRYQRITSSQFEISGYSPSVISSHDGLTVGVWMRPTYNDVLNYVFCKWRPADYYRSWRLGQTSAGKIVFSISSDGSYSSGKYDTVETPVTVEADRAQWYFVVGRWNTSEISLFVNGTKYTAAATQTGIFTGDGQPVSLCGRSDSTANNYHGDLSMAFVCGAYQPDETIESLWQATKGFFI